MNKFDNPFIPLPKIYQNLLLLFFFTYEVFSPILSLTTAVVTSESSFYIRGSLDVLYGILVFAPIVFYRKSYGILHPLIYISLLDIVTGIAKNPGSLLVFLQGPRVIPEMANFALPGWSQHDLGAADIQLKLLNLLALLCYYFGYFYMPQFKARVYNWATPKNLRTVSLALIVGSTVLLLGYLELKGGITSHMSSFGKGRDTQLSGEGMVHSIIRIGFFSFMIWYALDKNLINKPAFWFALALTVPAQFIAHGSRSSIVLAVIQISMLWVVHTKKLPAFRFILMGAFGVLMVGVLGDLRRSSFGGKEIDWDVLTNVSIEGAHESFEQDVKMRRTTKNSAQAIMALGLDEIGGPLYGKTYMGALFFFIPRAIWDDKPHSAGYYAGTQIYGSKGGVPPGKVVEAYWNFHLPGVIIMFTLFGMFHRWMAKFLVLNQGNKVAYVIYIVILQNLTPASLLMTLTLQCLTAVFIILLALNVVKLKFST